MSELPHIPGYQLRSELGRGGMAVVYSAIETSLDREVAIKIVGAADGDPDGQIERLENEARGLAALHHPHIVGLFTFGRTADGSLYYVMPLLPGGSLEEWPRPVPEERVLALLEVLLDALAHAHAADIVHRDIKPANILFDRHGRPMLADFGAALRRRRVSRLTMHGAAIGSSGYMSPEQARGLDVDARSDLYSTAVLAFELLTGHRPFEGADDLAIAIAQTEQPVPTLPPPLRHWQAFFERALAVNPANRHADAGAMLADLRALRSPAPRRARPRLGRGIAIAAGVVLLAAIAFTIVRWRTPTPPVRADAVAALFAAGRLTPPDEPNMQSELARSRTQEVDRAPLDALRQQLLARLGSDAVAALDGSDAAAATAAWQRWRDAVAALDATRDAEAIAQGAAIEAALRDQFTAALSRYDRGAATAASAVVAAWDDAPEPLRQLAADVAAIVAVGDRFADEGGPELVLVRAADDTRPALAAMTAALDAALYARYAEARGRTPAECADTAAPAQGCIDLATAGDIAAWLGERTQQAYRLPTRDELAAAIAHVGTAPAVAWTSTCNEVRVAQPRSTASRTWSGVRRLFGKGPTPQRVETRCDGNFALRLDGRGTDASVPAQATPETTVVLVREMTARP